MRKSKNEKKLKILDRIMNRPVMTSNEVKGKENSNNPLTMNVSEQLTNPMSQGVAICENWTP